MRNMRIAALMAVLCALAILPARTAEKDATAFEKLKSLAGVWEAKGLQGKPISTTFKVIANGTAIMEEMGFENMVNVYHPDGDKLMVTHYCAGNNQPRMVAAGLSADGKTLAFEFKDVTNRAGAKESIMNGLKITFEDADHMTQEWISSAPTSEPSLVMAFQRKK